jgi:hypothetical protein
LTLGLLALQAAPLVSLAAYNTIIIDGDGADWSTIPTFTDPGSDAGGGSGDITSLRITSDASTLYVRWDETLTFNKDSIASDGFSVAVNTSGGSTIDTIGWVVLNSQGVATVSVERPLGTVTTVGSAKQSCKFVACTNGAAVFIEAAFPLSALGASTHQIIGIQGQTLASPSINSNVKDCIPGLVTCSGFFSLDTATGSVSVNAGDTTATSVTCAPNPVQVGATATCTATVTDSTTPASVPVGQVL